MEGRSRLKLNDIFETELLSKALQRAHTFAQQRGANELANWLQLELGGYYSTNRAWIECSRVPKYRTVTGIHFNLYGQRLQLPKQLSFVNTLFLREPVEVLESLKDTKQTVVVQDPDAIEFIAEHLNVEVSTFHFDVAEIVNILSQIRVELINREKVLTDIPSVSMKAEKKEDILMLRPTFTASESICAHYGGA